jgi:hypothetical protein
LVIELMEQLPIVELAGDAVATLPERHQE